MRRVRIGLVFGAILALTGCLEGKGAQQTSAPPPVAQKAIRVDVWHDTICPWCRIGLHNLESVVGSWQGAPIEVVHHPFLLDPDMPPEGRDMREGLARKYGPERLDSMFARVSQAGAAYGVRFDWDKVRTSPATAPSHVFIEWVPAEKRSAAVAALHRAHFEEGRNIGDSAVLAAIAASVGLDAEAARSAVTDPARLQSVRARAAEASRSGISGVPHFVIGGRVLGGAQSPEALRQAIAAAAAP